MPLIPPPGDGTKALPSRVWSPQGSPQVPGLPLDARFCGRFQPGGSLSPPVSPPAPLCVLRLVADT